MNVKVKAGSLWRKNGELVKVSRLGKGMVRWYPVGGGGKEQSTTVEDFISSFVAVDTDV